MDSKRRASEILTGRPPRNALSVMNEERESSRNNEYDRFADRSAATKTKVANVGIDGEESSDHKMVHGLSSNVDGTDTDHFNSMMNIPNNQNEIMDFEFFMNGI